MKQKLTSRNICRNS